MPCTSTRPTWNFIFRTKIVPDNEPLDEIEPFIYLSNHVIRYIHENSNIVVFFHRLSRGRTVAVPVDDLEVFVAWDQNWVWWWVWYSKLCILSGFRWLSSTLHAMVNFHHKVKFHKHAFESKNTAPAVACHQKGLWGWNGYAQICNKANFPKHSTEGRQVTCFFHAVIIFTVQLGS